MERIKKNFYDYLLKLISVASAISVGCLVSAKNCTSGNDSWILLVLSAIVIALVFFGLEKFINVKYGDLYDFEKGIEGYWFESYSMKGSDYFGLIHFDFSDSSNELFVRGDLFAEDLTPLASWSSELVYIFRNGDNLFYRYVGRVKRDPKADDRIIRRIGNCHMDFVKEEDGSYHRSTGTFQDDSINYQTYQLTCDKISEELLVEILDTKFIKGEGDKKKLIMNLRANRSSEKES